jgi:hypothetical protein
MLSIALVLHIEVVLPSRSANSTSTNASACFVGKLEAEIIIDFGTVRATSEAAFSRTELGGGGIDVFRGDNGLCGIQYSGFCVLQVILHSWCFFGDLLCSWFGDFAGSAWTFVSRDCWDLRVGPAWALGLGARSSFRYHDWNVSTDGTDWPLV